MEAAGFELLHYEDLSSKVQRTWTQAGLSTLGHFFNRPSDLKMLLEKNNTNANFALSLLRIPLAYKIGVMKYGAYVLKKRTPR